MFFCRRIPLAQYYYVYDTLSNQLEMSFSSCNHQPTNQPRCPRVLMIILMMTWFKQFVHSSSLELVHYNEGSEKINNYSDRGPIQETNSMFLTLFLILISKKSAKIRHSSDRNRPIPTMGALCSFNGVFYSFLILADWSVLKMERASV